METLITIIHVLVCVFLILVVLLQSGRSGGMGAALGGASGQVFGGRGAGNFLAKMTTGAAVTFFLTSLVVSVLSSQHRSVVADAAQKEVPAAAPAPADAAPADAAPADAAPADGAAAPTDAAPAPADGTAPAAPPVEGAAPAAPAPAAPAAPTPAP
jgi:preprotein translocase subunit SecG